MEICILAEQENRYIHFGQDHTYKCLTRMHVHNKTRILIERECIRHPVSADLFQSSSVSAFICHPPTAITAKPCNLPSCRLQSTYTVEWILISCLVASSERQPRYLPNAATGPHSLQPSGTSGLKSPKMNENLKQSTNIGSPDVSALTWTWQ